MDIRAFGFGEEWAPLFVFMPLTKFGETRARVAMACGWGPAWPLAWRGEWGSINRGEGREPWGQTMGASPSAATSETPLTSWGLGFIACKMGT